MAIRRSIQGMLEELEPNLWEHCLSRLVDYGHTFSPEIEMAALALGSNEMLLHGEAVNIDMVSRLHTSSALRVLGGRQAGRQAGRRAGSQAAMSLSVWADLVRHSGTLWCAAARLLTHNAWTQAITTELAYNRGMISLTDRTRVFKTMQGLGLQLWHESCANLPMLLRALDDAVRARDGAQHLPTMVGIGSAVFLVSLPHEPLCCVLNPPQHRCAACCADAMPGLLQATHHLVFLGGCLHVLRCSASWRCRR